MFRDSIVARDCSVPTRILGAVNIDSKFESKKGDFTFLVKKPSNKKNRSGTYNKNSGPFSSSSQDDLEKLIKTVVQCGKRHPTQALGIELSKNPCYMNLSQKYIFCGKNDAFQDATDQALDLYTSNLVFPPCSEISPSSKVKIILWGVQLSSVCVVHLARDSSRLLIVFSSMEKNKCIGIVTEILTFGKDAFPTDLGKPSSMDYKVAKRFFRTLSSFVEANKKCKSKPGMRWTRSNAYNFDWTTHFTSVNEESIRNARDCNHRASINGEDMLSLVDVFAQSTNREGLKSGKQKLPLTKSNNCREKPILFTHILQDKEEYRKEAITISKRETLVANTLAGNRFELDNEWGLVPDLNVEFASVGLGNGDPTTFSLYFNSQIIEGSYESESRQKLLDAFKNNISPVELTVFFHKNFDPFEKYTDNIKKNNGIKKIYTDKSGESNFLFTRDLWPTMNIDGIEVRCNDIEIFNGKNRAQNNTDVVSLAYIQNPKLRSIAGVSKDQSKCTAEGLKRKSIVASDSKGPHMKSNLNTTYKIEKSNAPVDDSEKEFGIDYDRKDFPKKKMSVDDIKSDDAMLDHMKKDPIIQNDSEEAYKTGTYTKLENTNTDISMRNHVNSDKVIQNNMKSQNPDTDALNENSKMHQKVKSVIVKKGRKNKKKRSENAVSSVPQELKCYVVSSDDFTLLSQLTNRGGRLGGGAWRALYDGTQKTCTVAVKIVTDSVTDGKLSNGFSSMISEATIISKISHDNVIELVGLAVSNDKSFLLCKYYDMGSLDSFLLHYKNDDAICRHVRLLAGLHISRAMTYITGLGYVHRDLRPSNIFIESQEKVLLGDFGAARKCKMKSSGVYYKSKRNVLQGFVHYAAPEVLVERRYSEASDIYAFAITLLFVWCLPNTKAAFAGKTEAEVRCLVKGCKTSVAELQCFSKPPQCSEELWAIFIDCLYVDNSLRPTFQELSLNFCEVMSRRQVMDCEGRIQQRNVGIQVDESAPIDVFESSVDASEFYCTRSRNRKRKTRSIKTQTKVLEVQKKPAYTVIDEEFMKELRDIQRTAQIAFERKINPSALHNDQKTTSDAKESYV